MKIEQRGWYSDDELIEPLRAIVHRCSDRQLTMILMAVSQLLFVRGRDRFLERGRKVSATRRAKSGSPGSTSGA